MATTRKGLWWARDDRLRSDHQHRKDRRRGAVRPGRGLRPGLDALEARLTPSTFTPTTTSDLGLGSIPNSDINALGQITTQSGDPITLRSAIFAANRAGGSNTIDLPAGTYLLALTPSAGSNGGNGTTGELPVTSALTITGAGSATTIVEAGTSATNGISKVFSFNPLGELNGFAVSLTGLTIQDGKNNDNGSDGDNEGGAFDFDAGPDGKGSLTMNDVVVNQNSTTNGDGGGIALFDGGVVSITNSKFTNNTANGGTGGGIFIGGFVPVPTTAKLTIMGSSISDNVTAGADGGDGGGILSFANFPVAIHNSTISGNKTGTSQAFNGGGIADEGSDGLTIDQGTVISGNSATHWGGGLYSTDTGSITDTAIINNFAAGGVSSQSSSVKEGGGGIFADESSAHITVNDSRIVGNTATVGGSQLDGDGGSSDGGILDAANNWFGTNTNPLPSGFFGSGVKTLTTTPFLVMTFGASPTTLNSGATSALTASITKNSAGTTGFSVPDGTPASFSGGTIGSVNPSSTTTSSGAASTTFTAGSTPGKGNVSATIDNQTLTVQITVVGVPTANSQTVSVPFDTAKAITLTGSDPGGLSLTYSIATNPADGTLSGTAPDVTYTPKAGFHGSDSFTFTVNNGTSTSPAATVTLNVAAGVPTAKPQTVSVAFNTATAVTLSGTDPDSPALSLTYAFANPSHGVLTGTAPNLTYTPSSGFHGSDSFTFKVSNGINISAAATVTLNVAAGVPTANSQSVNVAFNTATAVTLLGSDPDSPPLALNYAVTANPGHGVLTGTAPNLTYTPNTGFHGSDSFTFKVSNGINISAAATVTLNVAAGVPTANPQSVSVAFNTATAVTLLGSDPDSPPLALNYAVTANPGHGSLSGTVPNLTYTPSAGFHGSDSFTFKVSNGINISAAATVTLNVAAGAPTAIPQTVSVAFNTATAVTLTGSDPDSPALSLTYAFANPAHGVLSGTAPNLTYTPNAGFHGSDSFAFTVNNGINTSPAATVTLNVATGVPTANPQTVTLNENASIGVSLTGSDPDSPALPLTFALVVGQGPAHGVISNFNLATGTLTYTPTSNYFGADSFQFTMSNGINTSAPATISLAVNQVQATVSGTVGISWGADTATATLLTNADGLRLLPAGRNTDLPWLDINKLSITLSQPETLSPADISVSGITVPAYSVVLSGSGTNYTITLVPAISVADRVTITIGNASIATYTRRLDVLPGDVNDDGVVNSLDMVIVRNMYLGFGTVTVPVLWGDINGDGTVNLTDYTLVRARVGTQLPPLPPQV